MLSKYGRVLVSVVLIGAVVLVAAAVAERSLAGKPKVEPHQLIILFSGDDRGEMKRPCG